MRWEGRRQSGNVEDRRRMTTPVAAGGGLMILAVAAIAWLLGLNPLAILNQAANVQQRGGAPADVGPAQDRLSAFVRVVLADTEDVWMQLFRPLGKPYRPTTLVLFSGQVQSACGFSSAAVGPFYCPADQKVYIDLSFFEEMERKLNAPGDFAQAYVLAHEVGHHVQNLLGVSTEVQDLRRRASKEEANRLSVRLELQADFLAGVWAHHAERNWRILEEGDIQEAMNAATAIGDDRLQLEARGYIVPESFTHGTSQQRMKWFMLGLRTGDIEQGDTFTIPYEQL